MKTTVAFVLAAALLIVSQGSAQVQPPSASPLSKLEQVIVFVVQREVAASHIENRTDVCVGFVRGSVVSEKGILDDLRNKGLKLRGNNWCSKGLRGMIIDILSPLSMTPVGVYEIKVQLADLNPIQQEGVHVGTLLRRGIYTVRYEEGYELQLETYQQNCCVGILGEKKVAEFCSSLTTGAYHSPQCDFWVVHDPKRVEDVEIEHKPSYHTYSRWKLGEQTYILAYRDVDYQPADMVADIYRVSNTGNNLIGKVSLYDAVTDVSPVGLTGRDVPDLVFRTTCGELQCVFVLRFADGKAQSVVSYGASEMSVVSETKPAILAKSRLANVVEEFAWDSRVNEFRKIRQYRWHKEE